MPFQFEGKTRNDQARTKAISIDKTTH